MSKLKDLNELKLKKFEILTNNYIRNTLQETNLGLPKGFKIMLIDTENKEAKYYKYDQNERVYIDPITNEKSIGAIYHLAFKTFYVIEETKTAVYLSAYSNQKAIIYGKIKLQKVMEKDLLQKVMKKDLFNKGYLTLKQKSDNIFVHYNSFTIAGQVRSCGNAELLKKIQLILNG